MFENLLLAREAAVAVLTINRPQVLNALNIATLDELRRAIIDITLTGRQVTAEEALRIGLVNRIVPLTELTREAHALAFELAGKPPIAMRSLLEAVNRGLDAPLGEAQVLEAALFGLVASTEDMREGTAAFLEKRKPLFKGR